MKRTHAQMEAREKPKRVVNPFVLFVQDVKANAADHAPTSRPELKKMWDEISDDKKTEIERQHARLMMAWQRDMASYVEEYPEDSDDEEEETVVVTKKKAKKEKAPRDPNKPRKYQNAYFHFQNEKRKELKEKNPSMGGREVQSTVSDLWKAMSDEDKKPYQALEAKQKVTYEKAMAKYNAGLAASGGVSGALASAAAAATALVEKTKKAQEKATKKKVEEVKKKKKAEKPKPKQIEEDVEMEEADDSDDERMEEDNSDDALADSADESEELGSDEEEATEDDEEESDDESESEDGAVIVESGSEEESSDEEDDSDSEEGVAVTFS